MLGQREEEKSGINRLVMLIIGMGVGAVLGVLYAPKAGVETREDLSELRRRNRGKVREILSNINEKIPGKSRAREAFGAVRERASEVGREAQEKVNEAFS